MAMGTTYISETTPVMVNGVHSNMAPTDMATKFGAGNLKTPTKDFTYTFNKQTFHARKGVPIVVDTALAAFFTAIGAPVV